MREAIKFRDYQKADETGWLRCRVLAFLDTAFFDSVEQRKPRFENDSIELVAETGGQIVGLVDVELEREAGTLGLERTEKAGIVWNIAVHPDFRRFGIARTLLERAAEAARASGMHWMEAWTRDDAFVRHWYEAMGFVKRTSYLHVFLDQGVDADMPGMTVLESFAHYTGNDPDAVRARFKRVHECSCYELRL